MINEPVAVSLFNNSPSNKSLDMTAKRRSWPDMSAQRVLTQSARVVGAFGIVVELDLGFGFVSGVRSGDRILVDSRAESIASRRGGPSVSGKCSISDIGYVQDEKRRWGGLSFLYARPGVLLVG